MKTCWLYLSVWNRSARNSKPLEVLGKKIFFFHHHHHHSPPLFTPVPSLFLFSFFFLSPPHFSLSPLKIRIKLKIKIETKKHSPFHFSSSFAFETNRGKKNKRRERRWGEWKKLEKKGTYDPIPKTPPASNDSPGSGAGAKYKDVNLDISRTKYWLGVGAQPSDPVWRLLSMVREVGDGPMISWRKKRRCSFYFFDPFNEFYFPHLYSFSFTVHPF